METLLLLSGLAGIIQLTVIVILIIRFFQLANDVKVLREKITISSSNFKTDFYKWIVANELEKAKEVLFNEIGNNQELQLILKGGNATYISQLKECFNDTNKKELKILGIKNNMIHF